MQPDLSAVTISPTATHTYSVIWLHGLGADGHDFEGIVPSLHLVAQPKINFVFPHAPIQAVTINNGMKMRAWFDILDMDPERHHVDKQGIYNSAILVEQLISAEIKKGVKPENIMLAGFSQGGAIALHLGLRYPHRLAGILALSTYMPTLDELTKESSSAGLSTPIFMAHGILDAVIAIEAGKSTYDRLTGLGYKVQWQDYLMEHSVCQEEIGHISAFMNAIFA